MLPLLPLRWPTPVDGLANDLARLVVDHAEVDGTGKRKVDGAKAATRLGAATSERWANERFRQVMLLVLEFRREWPNNSLLTDDDVQSIRLAVDSALYVVTRDGHNGDVYDVNATTWAIWLVQRAHTIKAGGWTVESADAQQRLTFEHLYRWLEGQHSLLQRHYIRDDTTGKVVHRYMLPFKKMKVPPGRDNMFKYRKAARRLSDWIIAGSSEQGTDGLAPGIVDQAPPTLVAPPPLAAQREARRAATWQRVMAGSRARSRILKSVAGETEDARETREMLEAIMQASRSVPSEQASPQEEYTAGSDDEMGALLEQELAEQSDKEAAGERPADQGSEDDLEVMLEQALSKQRDQEAADEPSADDGSETRVAEEVDEADQQPEQSSSPLSREEVEDVLDRFEKHLEESNEN